MFFQTFRIMTENVVSLFSAIGKRLPGSKDWRMDTTIYGPENAADRWEGVLSAAMEKHVTTDSSPATIQESSSDGEPEDPGMDEEYIEDWRHDLDDTDRAEMILDASILG